MDRSSRPLSTRLVIDEQKRLPRAMVARGPGMEQDSTGGWHLREHPERLPFGLRYRKQNENTLLCSTWIEAFFACMNSN